MFSDPLVLAIIAMVVGILLGAICCVLAFMVYLDVHEYSDQGLHLPSDNDLQQMCLWYEAEYGRKEKSE